MKKKYKKKQKIKSNIDIAEFVKEFRSKTDVFGSWTGHPLDEYETPVQDADDL